MIGVYLNIQDENEAIISSTMESVKKSGVKFSELYSQLPSRVSTTTAKNLSIPICIVCLLHLANEKVSTHISRHIKFLDYVRLVHVHYIYTQTITWLCPHACILLLPSVGLVTNVCLCRVGE